MAMGAFQNFFFFLIISCYILTIASEQEETGFVSSINPKLFKKKEAFSHFKFYWQDIVGGNNATSIPIIQPLPKFNNDYSVFGLVRIFDNALTLGPKLSSKLLGRAQGFLASTSQTELDFLMVMNFALFEGKYNGSAITILGRDVAYNETREMSVIGGSGVFRFAKGYAVANTISYDPITINTIVEYNIFVSHRY